MSAPLTVASTTRRIRQAQVEAIRSLIVGQRIRIVQTIRVGARKWEAPVEGTYRALNYLATGITTDRVPKDDVIAPIIHFTKDNGELSSIAVDENTRIEHLG